MITDLELATLDYWKHRQISFMQRVKPADYMDVLVYLTLAMLAEDCIDNIRVYPENMLEEFNKQTLKGCCGSYNDAIMVNGNRYYIGFNYGH